MAEIPIQEKRGGSKLPLILGGLLLLLLLGWCLTRNRGDDTVQTDTAGATTTVPADTVGGTGTAPRSDTALTTPGAGTTTGTGTGTTTGTATGTTTGTATGTGTSTRP